MVLSNYLFNYFLELRRGYTITLILKYRNIVQRNWTKRECSLHKVVIRISPLYIMWKNLNLLNRQS